MTAAVVIAATSPAIGAEPNVIPDTIKNISLGDSYAEVMEKTKELRYLPNTIQACRQAIPLDECTLISTSGFSQTFIVVNDIPYWLIVRFDKNNRATEIRLNHHIVENPALQSCIVAYEMTLDLIYYEIGPMQFLQFEEKDKAVTRETPAKNKYAIAPSRYGKGYDFAFQKSSPFKAPPGTDNNAFKANSSGRYIALTGSFSVTQIANAPERSSCNITLSLNQR